MPASEFTICAYIAHLASSMAGSSIANAISAVKSWHTASGAYWPPDGMIRMALRGAANMAPPGSSTSPREPVTTRLLETLVSSADQNKAEDRAFIAIALVAFWGLCRLGELLDLLSHTFEPGHLPSRRDLGTPASSNGSRSLRLPRTKTSQLNGEHITITAQQAPLDPITALENHLSLSQSMPPNAHLFAYFDDADGTIRVLSKKRFLARCNTIWSTVGIKNITGHCFRIGGTTALLKAGVPTDVIRSIGRWNSDAFFRYWRDSQAIAITHAEHIDTSSYATQLASTSATDVTSRPTAGRRRRQGDRS
jgi:hypothetical protein